MTNLPKVSDAGVWMNCNGSFRAQQAYPPLDVEPSQSRLEGRACHEVAQKLFRNEPFGELVGSLSKDGIVITDELFDAAREYFNEVWLFRTTLDIFFARQDLNVPYTRESRELS